MTAPAQTTKYTWKRFWLSVGFSVFFALAGLGVRIAEDGQVGYTNDTSMWIFAISGLCLYYALIVVIVRWRLHRRGVKITPPGYWD